MRDDPTSRSAGFARSDLWDRQKYVDVLVRPRPDGSVSPEGFKFESNSLSGNERNRFFLQGPDDFADLSLLSGLDDLDDGRSFALLDLDRDGWQDIALLSLNAPRFKLYRNRLAELSPNRRVLRLRLTGRHQAARPDGQVSNRDAIGARVTVEFASGRKVMLHKQAGEGFGGQNSGVLSIGVPEGDEVRRLKIRWPSGRTLAEDAPDLTKILTFTEPDA